MYRRSVIGSSITLLIVSVTSIDQRGRLGRAESCSTVFMGWQLLETLMYVQRESTIRTIVGVQ